MEDVNFLRCPSILVCLKAQNAARQISGRRHDAADPRLQDRADRLRGLERCAFAVQAESQFLEDEPIALQKAGLAALRVLRVSVSTDQGGRRVF